MPDFLSIGAARAVTTALYEALKDHPQICLTAAKVTNYFAYKDVDLAVKGPGAEFINNSVTDLAGYKDQYDAAKQGQILGEICPLYLFEPTAPGNMHAAVPDAKLIVTLRNPIEQAFSHFLYSRYLALFPREQILILDYETFRADDQAYPAEICRFIGVDDGHCPQVGEAVNAGEAPKNRALQELLMRPSPLTAPARILPVSWRRAIRDRHTQHNAGGGERMPNAARAILSERLWDDVAVLSALLDRDYSHWLE